MFSICHKSQEGERDLIEKEVGERRKREEEGRERERELKENLLNISYTGGLSPLSPYNEGEGGGDIACTKPIYLSALLLSHLTHILFIINVHTSISHVKARMSLYLQGERRFIPRWVGTHALSTRHNRHM